MVMPQIETVVFLMMENRSLDNVLGWLYNDCKPAVVYPPGSSPDFDGIPSDASNSCTDDLDITWSYSPSNGTAGFPGYRLQNLSRVWTFITSGKR